MFFSEIALYVFHYFLIILPFQIAWYEVVFRYPTLLSTLACTSTIRAKEVLHLWNYPVGFVWKHFLYLMLNKTFRGTEPAV